MKTNPDSRPIIEIGEANFESAVLRWKQPVVVAFSAAWSRPCQILDSVLGEVAPFGWPFRPEFSLLPVWTESQTNRTTSMKTRNQTQLTASVVARRNLTTR